MTFQPRTVTTTKPVTNQNNGSGIKTAQTQSQTYKSLIEEYSDVVEGDKGDRILRQ